MRLLAAKRVSFELAHPCRFDGVFASSKITKMRWILTILLIGLLFLGFQPAKSLALEPRFKTSFDLYYQVNPSGLTIVRQNFRLTNLTNLYYPTELIIPLAQKQTKNIRVFDDGGAVPFDASSLNDGLQLRLKFSREVFGLGETLNWTIVYETGGVASLTGRLWEIRIPKPAEIEGLEDYSLNLSIPAALGKLVYITPKPASEGSYRWTKQNFSALGITAIFDPQKENQSYRRYDFNLRYQLYNPKLYPVTVEITLPPDTNYQKIFLNNLSPRPAEVNSDQDNNWRAKYTLGPLARLEVVASGSAAVFFRPELPPPTVSTTSAQITDPPFVFSLNGRDSGANLALPTEISILAAPGDLDVNLPPRLSLLANIPSQLTAGFPSSARVFVENYGPTVFAGDNAYLQSQILTTTAPFLPTGIILPFGHASLDFNFLAPDWRLDRNDIISLRFAQQQRDYPVVIRPLFRQNFILIVGGLFLLGLVSIIAQIVRGLKNARMKL